VLASEENQKTDFWRATSVKSLNRVANISNMQNLLRDRFIATRKTRILPDAGSGSSTGWEPCCHLKDAMTDHDGDVRDGTDQMAGPNSCHISTPRPKTRDTKPVRALQNQ
jgi:hypothetical protein